MKSPTLLLFGVLFLALWGSIRIVADIRAERGYLGHLARAAHTTSVETAQREMDIALVDIEQGDLTSGYTSVLYQTPDEDLGFWYQNLKSARTALTGLEKADALTQSNGLLKLHETLIVAAHGDSGDGVRAPEGITVYGHNGLLLCLAWGSALIGLFALLAILTD